MTVHNYTDSGKPKQGSLKDSEDIARQTEEFLKEHEITEIPTGKSGIVEKPKKGMQVIIKSKRGD